MPQYVIRLVHSPEQCPTSNAAVRERMVKGAGQIPQMAQQAGIKFVAGPLLLQVEHEAIAVVEAASIEAVNDFIVRTGFMQWNTVRVSAAATMEQTMKDLEKMPPPIF